MTTHKPVTEADIARLLEAAVDVGHDGSTDQREVERWWAALPEPEPTARENRRRSTVGCRTCGHAPPGWCGHACCDQKRRATDATSSRPAAPESRAALEGLVASVATMTVEDGDGETLDFWTVPPEPLELARAALTDSAPSRSRD